MWRPVTRSLLVFSCGVCLFAASGCSLFRAGVPDIFVAEPPQHLPGIEEPASASALAMDPLASTDEAVSNATSCYIEIRALGKDPKRIRMSLEDAPNVQAVLEQTGLIKRFKNMQIELSRTAPNGTRHKMEIHYDAKKDHVASLFDYALHPNDLLVVRQESMTSFDEMMKKLAGPLAR